MAASKKGMSAAQMGRMLGITYKSAWFLCHRIREAMNSPSGPLGGGSGVVEADETYVGGKAKNRSTRKPAKKKAVVALVERDGHARSFHFANVNAKTGRYWRQSRAARRQPSKPTTNARRNKIVDPRLKSLSTTDSPP